MARNQGTNSGYFGGPDDLANDAGLKSLNDKLRETFNLPETASGQLPGIDDHSPTNVRRHHYFNNIMNGVKSTTTRKTGDGGRALGSKQQFISSNNPHSSGK